MDLSYKYSVLRVVPNLRRGECVNIGIVVFLPDALDVRISPSLAKVSALDGSVDLQRIIELPKAIKEIHARFDSVESLHAALKNLGFLTVSDLGWFELDSSDQYEKTVLRLMKSFVLPVAKPQKANRSSERLITTLKAKFKQQGILGDAQSDLAKHLVVPKFPIDPDENLYADFMLKNGFYRATETADFRGVSAGELEKLRIAGLAAIKLDKAKTKFGEGTKRYVIYASATGSSSHSQVGLLGDYADHVFDIESKSEMSAYMDQIMQAASHTTSGI